MCGGAGRQTLLLPSTQQGSGPFPHHAARQWLDADGINSGRRFAAISFYLALMTATCLDLIGADGPTTVEGPFARNRLFVGMLAAATGTRRHRLRGRHRHQHRRRIAGIGSR